MPMSGVRDMQTEMMYGESTEMVAALFGWDLSKKSLKKSLV